MCWSHVLRNCEEKSCAINQETRNLLLGDIKDLQNMPSTESFNHAVKLFFEKWQSDCGFLFFDTF